MMLDVIGEAKAGKAVEDAVIKCWQAQDKEPGSGQDGPVHDRDGRFRGKQRLTRSDQIIKAPIPAPISTS